MDKFFVITFIWFGKVAISDIVPFWNVLVKPHTHSIWLAFHLFIILDASSADSVRLRILFHLNQRLGPLRIHGCVLTVEGVLKAWLGIFSRRIYVEQNPWWCLMNIRELSTCCLWASQLVCGRLVSSLCNTLDVLIPSGWTVISHIMWISLQYVSIKWLFVLKQSIQLEEVSFDIGWKLLHQMLGNQRCGSRCSRRTRVLSLVRQTFLRCAYSNSSGQPVLIIWQLLYLLLILFINLVLHVQYRLITFDGLTFIWNRVLVHGLNAYLSINRIDALAFHRLVLNYLRCSV